MAKLSAYRQREVLRVERERETPDDDLCSWRRTTLAVMSNGRVLEKRDVIFRPDAFNPSGRRHSFGWKVKGRLAATATPETFRAAYERSGWRVVSCHA